MEQIHFEFKFNQFNSKHTHLTTPRKLCLSTPDYPYFYAMVKQNLRTTIQKSTPQSVGGGCVPSSLRRSARLAQKFSQNPSLLTCTDFPIFHQQNKNRRCVRTSAKNSKKFKSSSTSHLPSLQTGKKGQKQKLNDAGKAEQPIQPLRRSARLQEKRLRKEQQQQQQQQQRVTRASVPVPAPAPAPEPVPVLEPEVEVVPVPCQHYAEINEVLRRLHEERVTRASVPAPEPVPVLEPEVEVVPATSQHYAEINEALRRLHEERVTRASAPVPGPEVRSRRYGTRLTWSLLLGGSVAFIGVVGHLMANYLC